MSDYPRYDDGLDADGYPLERKPWREPYRHGCEAAAGDVQFQTLEQATLSAIERIGLFLEISPDCESPIENWMGAALLTVFEAKGALLTLFKGSLEGAPDGLLLVPQFRWGYYRSDWALVQARPHSALLIECDGREFHSSKEQLEHDAKKDAAALNRGYLTMRFTGSEIYRNADACATKVYDAVAG